MDTSEALADLRTLRDLIRWGASRFAEQPLWYGHGTDNPLDEAAALVFSQTHLPHTISDAYLDTRLTASERQSILNLMAQRVDERVPVPYLTHEAWFCGLSFYVDERVLIPRSPIAEMIQARFQPWFKGESIGRIVDVGTGSGCIAIACAHAFPEAVVDAVDLSPEALEVAQLNVNQHGLFDQVNVIESDLLNAVEDQVYDLIVSNPPYVSEEEMTTLPDEYAHEPEKALVSGEFGLDHVLPLMRSALDQLSDAGLLVVEVGNSWEALEALLPDVPFQWLEFENGGDGVFVIDAPGLRACAESILEIR